jgi:hypothetical protein
MASLTTRIGFKRLLGARAGWPPLGFAQQCAIVTSETITVDSRKESRRPNSVPQRYLYLLVDDFGTAGGSRVPTAGRQLPVVSA